MRPALLPTSLALLACCAPLAAQSLRLPAIERDHRDVIALVADARTGATLGGARTAEARTVRLHPGSLFKLAIAVAALESSARPEATHDCDGLDTIAGHAYRCWTAAGHGSLDLDDAIARSCNLYFRRIAAPLSRSTILARAHALGLVAREDAPSLTDANLLGEAADVTPEMMLRTALALASRGRLAPSPLQLASARYRPLYAGLRECVRIGTARSAWSSRIAIAGKTGTIERGAGRHAGWFIGFAPIERPRYAIVVLDRSGMGSDAASIAREILEGLL
jgi:cell division protein FtsI/penicillin-binding protein 2